MVSHNSAGGYAGAGSRLRKTLASGLAIAACFSSPVYAGTTSYSYDTLGRVKTVSFPDGTAFSYTYDAAGNRIQSVSTRGFTPPTATADSVTTAYNTALTFDPRSNDSSLYGSGLTITAVGTPSHGSVTNNSGTGLTYTPTSGYYGSDSFTYTISDGYNTATATVSVTVSVPPAPSVSAQSLSVAYNTAGTVSLTPSGVYTSVSAATGPSHGAVSISGTTATYTPTSGYYGSDSFTYTGTGPGGTSAPATVSITVASPSAPTVSNASLSSAYNTAGTVNLTIGGVYTSAAVATTPAHGTASISGATATYTPTNGYYGSDSFTYTATGPGGTSAPATVSVTVATPPAPTVSGKSLSVAYNTAGSMSLTPGGVYTSVSTATNPSHGSVSISGTTATYTPTSGYYGSDSFTYTATGPGGTSSPATVSVTVATPAAPTAGNVALTTAYNTAGSVTLAPGGVYSSTALATSPSHGSATVSGTTATYTPTSGYSGADSFTYSVSGPGGTGTGTVSVTVQAQPVVSINVTVASNLRTLANNAGYSSTAIYNFIVPSGTSVLGASGGGAAIDTGAWPAGQTVTLTVNGNVYGGGGKGGNGGYRAVGAAGGAGGDAVYVQAPLTIVIASGASIKGGGGGGGGSGATTYNSKYYSGGLGCGGGGGFPNGAGGSGQEGFNTSGADITSGSGGTGTTSGGGSGGSTNCGTGYGGAGGAAATAGSTGGTNAFAGGAGGAAGYAVRKNGNTVTVTNNGTLTGTAG